MSPRPRQLHLNLFGLGSGRHEAAWRHPDAAPVADHDIDAYVRNAQLAERGRFDALFLADSAWAGPLEGSVARGGFEPLTLLSALAARTTHLGLIATSSTTYNEPYNVARQFASLDLISGGRSGWNVVTTSEPPVAANYTSEPHPPHDVRYERSAEFVDVVLALWDSWDHGVVVGDKAAGVHSDLSRLREIRHKGSWFSVRGPLNVPRSPQERPLVVQAGSSDRGRDFAATYADAIFTAQPLLPGAQSVYADFKARAVARGRTPDSIKILPGLSPVLGGTEAEARALLDELNALIVPEFALSSLRNITGIDLSGVPLDDPLPERLGDEAGFQGLTSRLQAVLSMSRGQPLTVRQLIERFAAGFGHRVVVGTPEQVADEMETWFREGAADGFNVMPALVPTVLEAFVDHVVPELQRRGIFRRDYEGTTLRSHYDAELV